MKLYHGTSTMMMPDIRENGLENPYLTPNEDIAHYYAECAVDSLGGEEVVVCVDADEKNLRYDGAAMDEPVMANYEDRDNQWQLAAQDHPEWTTKGYLSIPSTEFCYSLAGVSSVWHEGIITLFEEM